MAVTMLLRSVWDCLCICLFWHAAISANPYLANVSTSCGFPDYHYRRVSTHCFIEHNACIYSFTHQFHIICVKTHLLNPEVHLIGRQGCCGWPVSSLAVYYKSPSKDVTVHGDILMSFSFLILTFIAWMWKCK